MVWDYSLNVKKKKEHLHMNLLSYKILVLLYFKNKLFEMECISNYWIVFFNTFLRIFYLSFVVLYQTLTKSCGFYVVFWFLCFKSCYCVLFLCKAKSCKFVWKEDKWRLSVSCINTNWQLRLLKRLYYVM